jgi:hypothetical protein
MKRNILTVVTLIFSMLLIIHNTYMHKKLKDAKEKKAAIIKNFSVIEEQYKILYEDYTLLDEAYTILEEENQLLGSYIANKEK